MTAHPDDLKVSRQLKDRKVRRQAADRARTEQQERRYQSCTGSGTRPVEERHLTWIDLVLPGPAAGSHTRDRSGIAFYREEKSKAKRRKPKTQKVLAVQGAARAQKRREARAEASRPVPDLLVHPKGTRAQRRARGVPSERQVKLASAQVQTGTVTRRSVRLLMRNRGGRGA